MISSIRGIICDLDGTLYENENLQKMFHQQLVTFIANKKNMEFYEAAEIINSFRNKIYNGRLKKSELDILPELGLQIIDWMDYCNCVIRPSDYLNPDYELIEILSNKNSIWIDVATNSSYMTTERILGALGIRDNINTIWTPDCNTFKNLNICKPSYYFYSKILQYHKQIGDNVVVIGDREIIDMSYTKELNMRYTYVVKSIDETKELLRKIFN